MPQIPENRLPDDDDFAGDYTLTREAIQELESPAWIDLQAGGTDPWSPQGEQPTQKQEKGPLDFQVDEDKPKASLKVPQAEEGSGDTDLSLLKSEHDRIKTLEEDPEYQRMVKQAKMGETDTPVAITEESQAGDPWSPAGSQEGDPEVQGLEAPLIEPVMAASATFSSAAYLGSKAGMALIPNVVKALGRGTIAYTVDHPIGITTELVAEAHDINPFVLNMFIGLAVGMTGEAKLEHISDMVIDFFGKGAKKSPKLIKEINDGIRAAIDGDFTNPMARTVHEIVRRNLANEHGFIAGSKAQRIDVNKFKLAKQMDKKGVDPEKVRIATGFSKGKDNKWRWEGDDSQYKFNTQLVKETVRESMGADDVFAIRYFVDHPELFKNYPELEKTKIRFTQTVRRLAATKDEILINPNKFIEEPEEMSKDVLHEIQHVIQDFEGFSGGGSPEFVKHLDTHKFQEYTLENIFMGDATVAKAQARAMFRMYTELAGEAEANDVVERMVTGINARAVNLDEARKVYLKLASEYDKTAPNVDKMNDLQTKMYEMGFDMTDESVAKAFADNDFDLLVPTPKVIAEAENLIWKNPENPQLALSDKGEFLDMKKNVQKIADKQDATVNQFKATYPEHSDKLLGLGVGAGAGITHDKENDIWYFDPERALKGMLLAAGGVAAISQLRKFGVEAPGKGGKTLRGNFSKQDTVKTFVKSADKSKIDPAWDGVSSFKEAQEVAKNMTWMKPQIVEEATPKKPRYSLNNRGYYGNDKMAFPSAVYKQGRNTFDYQGCGREAYARANGLQQTAACYGAQCYAEVLNVSKGRGSVTGNKFYDAVKNRDLRRQIEAVVATDGLEGARAQFPNVILEPKKVSSTPRVKALRARIKEVLGGDKFKKDNPPDPDKIAQLRTENPMYEIDDLGKVKTYTGMKVISREVPAGAQVTKNLAPLNGQDLRLGVDTDGSAWIADPEVMDAILDAKPGIVTIYSSAYHTPPPPHALSGRSIINVTVSGWHALPETLHRLEWARQARANGWNVIIREVTADDKAFEKGITNLYNRWHDGFMKTDFFPMEQPLHMGATHGKPVKGLPGCCKGSKNNPRTCDSCEVAEGLGKGFREFHEITEEGGNERILPDVEDYDVETVKSSLKGTTSKQLAKKGWTPEVAQKTQRAETIATYDRVNEVFESRGIKPNEVLDYGAGKGMGSDKYGWDSFEPHAKDWMPDYRDAGEINKTYKGIVSQYVLNVVPDDMRDDIVRNMGELLEPDGTAVIITRGSDVKTEGLTKAGTFQKGFTKPELKKYIETTLGKGYEVEGTGIGTTGVIVRKVSMGEPLPMAKSIAAGQKAKDGLVQRAVKRSAEILSDETGAVSTEPIVKQNPVAKMEKAVEAMTLPFKEETFLAKAGNINLNRIEDEAGIKDALEQVGKVFEPEITKARRGVRSNEATMKAASKAETLALSELLGREVGQAFNAEQAVRARLLLVSSANRLVDLAKKASAPMSSKMDQWEFRKAFNLHYAIQQQVQGMTAEAGRALQSFNIQAKSMKEMLKNMDEAMNRLDQIPGMNTKRMADAMAQLETPEKIGKVVNKVATRPTYQMFIEAWINGLLSGPKTHLVNMLSNTLVALWQIPERLTAAGFGKILGGDDSVQAGEALQQAFGMVEGAKKGIKLAGKSLWSGTSGGTDVFSKVEGQYDPAITAANMREALPFKNMTSKMLREGGMMAKAVDFIGETIRIPGRFLSAEDEFFKSVGYQMELNAQAYRMGVSEGLKGDALAKRMTEILEDPAKHTPEIHMEAVDAARYQTFTNPLGQGGMAFQNFVNKVPALRIVVPFIRTPTNIIKFAMARTPVAWMSPKIRADIMAGGSRRDLALARISLGSAAMMTVGAFAAQGLVTGGGPKDPALQANLRRTGWQPYSIKVGDKYVSYQRLEPLGALFGLAADFVEIAGLGDDNSMRFEDFEDLAVACSVALSKNVTSKTWLRGVSDFIHVMDEPDRYMQRYLQRLVGSVIPSMSSTIESVASPEHAAVNSMMDAMKARIPGLGDNLPPKRDLWGKPLRQTMNVNKPSNWIDRAYVAISPVYISTEVDSPIDKEMHRLQMSIRRPSMVQSFDGVPIELGPKQYDDFVVSINSVKMANGKVVKDALNDLIKSKGYKDQFDETKTNMVRKMYSEAIDIAKNKMVREDPSLRRIIMENKRKP